MYNKYQLEHWLTPYGIEKIIADCKDHEVYIVEDEFNNIVGTFQLLNMEFHNKQTLHINKFATKPQFSGLGYGRKMLLFIENICKTRGINYVSLDVYDKSEDAIRFYKKNGFVVTGERYIRRFVVLLMEKTL